MEIVFSKIHGLGNDFVTVNEFEKELVSDKAKFAKKFCDRHLGVGADGILFLCKSNKADFKMRIFNADGSEAENCVNGLRCIAFEKFLIDNKSKGEYKIETLQGIVEAKVSESEEDLALVELQLLGKREFKGKFSIVVKGKAFEYYDVDVGNPHAVVFLKESVKDFPLEEIGHAFECHEAFKPNRTNTEFVNIVSPTKVNMRVHERGVCETMACGSGSIAIVIAGINAGVLEENKWVNVEQPGGTLEIKADKDIFLRGPAQKVFKATLKWGD